MQHLLKTLACRTIGAVAALAVGSSTVSVAAASDAMPVAQQNALVQKYCAVCHTDAARNGGLSLEHFDASHVDPSLAAMLVSKLKNGAIGAAGVPVPDQATIGALVSALASEAVGSHEWTVNQTQDAATKQPIVTASILRELPSAKNAGEPSMYRLVLACNAGTHQGEMQLSWSPVPKTGTLSASLDGKAPLTYKVEGIEKMGNGAQGTAGPAAITLYETTKASGQTSGAPKLAMPLQTLTISNLFPDETVVFPFGALTEQARLALSTCFTGSSTGR